MKVKPAFAALCLAFAGAAFGQASEVAKPDAAVEQRLKGLAEELRCLVCQNQTIADSHAPLAVDLRNQIRGQIAQGRTDDDIRAYMVQRYGDFILYRPALKATTLVLWLGPFALLAAGIGIFMVIVRARRAAPRDAAIDPVRRAEIETLLAGDAPRAEERRATSAGRSSGKRRGP
jgi:cytochrome c-type biogenesis protein CcmH